MKLIEYISTKVNIRFIYAIIFCFVLVATHVLWRTIVDTGMENKEYQKREEQGMDVGILAKLKDFTWEITVGEKPDRTRTATRYIAVFGYDLSQAFEPLCKATTDLVTPLCNLFKGGFEKKEYDVNGEKRYIIQYKEDENSGFEVVWGCTSVKQIIMFFLIMMTTYGKFKHKIIYFLICIPVIILINSLRISGIVCLSTGNMENFSFWHDGVFRTVYYLTMLLLWLIWIEYITKRIYKDEKI